MIDAGMIGGIAVRKYINKLLLFFIVISSFSSYSYVLADDDHYARGVVIQELKFPNELQVGGGEFKTKINPKGKGGFVYDPRTRFNGVERNLLWLVLDDTAYPLNGPSKMLTPQLKWPREVSEIKWEKTGLSPFFASEAIEIIFGKSYK